MEAMSSTLGMPKVEVMEKTLKDINPFAHVKTFGYITSDTLDAFLEDVDIVIDSIDFFEQDARRMIFNAAKDRGIPVITAAPVGFGSSVLVFTQEGMGFDEYFDIHDTTSDEMKPLLFGIGLTPSLLQRSYFAPEKIDMNRHDASSSVLGIVAAANWVGSIVYKLVNGDSVEAAPISYHFDPHVLKMKRTHLYFGNRNIVQRLKLWYVKRKMAELS
jgi:molybdopterin/thiamine biosynthesis adenylyltransferase